MQKDFRFEYRIATRKINVTERNAPILKKLIAKKLFDKGAKFDQEIILKPIS